LWFVVLGAWCGEVNSGTAGVKVNGRETWGVDEDVTRLD